MKDSGDPIPVYIKMSILLIGLIAFFYFIYISQDILLPLVFSILVAILLNPVVEFMTRKKMNRILAIFITLLLAVIVMASLIFFIWTQISSFSESLPHFREKFNLAFKELSNWIAGTFNISIKNFNDWISKKINDGMNNSALIGNTVNTATHFFVSLFLIPVYIFFVLLYKHRIIEFIKRLFDVESHTTVSVILSQIKKLIQQYLVGLLLEMALVSTMTAVALFALGIQNPVLFGILTGLLNMIPYVGIITANATIALIAFVTKSPATALYVIILSTLVQFIDNSFIVPKVVGSKVKINGMATILSVIAGGQLCGVPGMFLAIPVVAVFKAICDNVEGLKPVGYLLGDTTPTERIIDRFTKRKKG